MAGSRLRSIITGLLVSAALQLFAGSQDATQTHSVIGVSVYNYVQVPATDLARAKRTAAQIFRQARLEIVWTDVPVFSKTKAESTRSAQGLRFADLRLRILGESKVPEWAAKSKEVAFSLLPSNGAPGVFTSIYYERLLTIARRESRPVGLVLGCVIAHELGHLLLDMRGHSRTGIMSFPVTRHYLAHASQGRLLFTASQARRLRRKVRERIGWNRQGGQSLLARSRATMHDD